eukprot:TRINITY_DN4465_c0_g2_i1.p1 TRINITY_DN4465_c0_g2~~TRINITY_DN4465_c0_g2_i1.p1  ORF type:complete len:250 (-),score=74.26 TRINITY_DN4465_c0_g2_i1:64-813(-)
MFFPLENKLRYKWECVAVDDSCPANQPLLDMLSGLESELNLRRNSVLCTVNVQLTHPVRALPADSTDIETSMGNFFADIVQAKIDADVMLLISGALRLPTLGPVITVGAVQECLPFDNDHLVLCCMSGRELQTAFAFFMAGYHDKPHRIFQVSRGVHAVFDVTRSTLVSLTLRGAPLDPNRRYVVGCTEWAYNNRDAVLGLVVPPADAAATPQQECTVIASLADVVTEVLRTPRAVPAVGIEGRLVLVR